MTEESKNLPNMPDLVLKNISEMIGPFDVQNMRKVCHRLRSYLDVDSPSYNYDTLALVMDTYKTTLSYIHESTYLTTNYQRSGRGSIVSSNKSHGQTVLLGNDSIDLLCNDLKQNVVKHKSKIKHLFVDVEHHNASRRFMKKLPALLSSEHPLKVKKVYMTVYKVQELHMVLPYLDKNEIETIAMFQARKCRTMTLSVKDMDRIASLDIWKKAKTIICQMKLASSASIHHFFHIKDITFQFEELFIADLKKLKETMLSPTSNFKMTQISYTRFKDEEMFIASLGPFGHPSRHGKTTWYFQHQNDRILNVVYRPHWILIGWDNNIPQGADISKMF